jgi:hypothetical protein
MPANIKGAQNIIKRNTILLLLCLFLIKPAPLWAEKMTDTWRITGYTKYRDAVFADISRITTNATGTKFIWVKIAPANKSQYFLMINEYLQTVNKSDRGFRSIEILCEIYCQRHLIRFTKFVYCDNAKNIIHEVDETNLGWLSILQGNIWYNVEKETCLERKPQV